MRRLALLSLAVLVPTLLAADSGAAPAAANETLPNILFLMCDSMDGRVVDPSSPVSKYVATPTLDALAAEGVNFVRTYANSPQCVPRLDAPCPRRSATSQPVLTWH